MKIVQEGTGCSIEGEFTSQELAKFKAAGWKEVDKPIKKTLSELGVSFPALEEAD